MKAKANKQNILSIDLNKWTTQTAKAKEKGCSVEYICKLIRLGKLECLEIEELGLRLVER